MKHDNRGMTLIELLTALAVSTVILSGAAYMLFSSLTLSGRNNASVEVQSEAQMALNMLADNIMEAKGIGIRIPAAGESTECFFFGEMLIKKAAGRDYELFYKGNVLATDIGNGKSGNIYLIEFPNEKYEAAADGYCRLASHSEEAGCVAEGMDKALLYIKELSGQEKIKWLLAQNVTELSLTPVSAYGQGGFEEPFMVSIKLSVENDSTGKSIRRTLEDKIAVRNRLDSVYMTASGGAHSSMKKFERQE